jgi:hypothetical protein
MEDTKIEKANGKCSINFNNKDSCKCKVENFTTQNNVSNIVKYVRLAMWFILITVIVYLILSFFI